MSDQAPRPGWWKASDGKWYPPADASRAPAPGSWLYYVLADASGRHAFATTDAEFEQLRRQAQQKGLL